jgi:hypothetical protein
MQEEIEWKLFIRMKLVSLTFLLLCGWTVNVVILLPQVDQWQMVFLIFDIGGGRSTKKKMQVHPVWSLQCPQPRAAEIYYSCCGKIDQHNRHRQSTLAIERQTIGV